MKILYDASEGAGVLEAELLKTLEKAASLCVESEGIDPERTEVRSAFRRFVSRRVNSATRRRERWCICLSTVSAICWAMIIWKKRTRMKCGRKKRK